MVKSIFKVILYTVVFSCLAVLIYLQYDNWQDQKNAEEIALSPQGKLPDNVHPKSYRLKLRIEPSKGLFSGEVTIALNVKKRTDKIWLHGKGLNADEVKIVDSAGRVTSMDYHEMGESGVVKLSAESHINKGNATLYIKYSADLATDLTGLYLVEEAGEHYAFTQFEATDARKAFPSFDEPRFKVPFSIELEVKDNVKAFTNTLKLSEEPLGDGFKVIRYQTTKPLPTYLVAFAVGNFDVVEYDDIPVSALRSTTIPLRGIAVKGKGEQLNYALKHTADILMLLESYFGEAYPYKKLDLVAVPDFAAGAMENAGLITYREQLLLLGNSPSIGQVRSYAKVHAHELAHQWFGNLVTMPWWDDLWLNEAFATWMAGKTMIAWNSALSFERDMIRAGHSVMNQDIFAHTRKISEPIVNNNDIDNAFDSITYRKGGAVLQMLENFIGDDVFREGVRHYIRRFQFGHATSEQFIESIMHVANVEEVGPAFNSFLFQQGVPLITLSYSCSPNTVNIQLAQKRYLPIGASSESQQNWSVPICLNLLERDSERQVCTLLTQPQSYISITSEQCPVAIMPNEGGKGYYRWNISKDKLDFLIKNLNRLSKSERFSVASHLNAEFRAGRLNVNEYLRLAQPFSKQNLWDLVTAPVSEIQFITDYMANDQEQLQIKKIVDTMYTPLLKKLGVHATTEQDKINEVDTALLRKRILSLFVYTQHDPEVLKPLAELAKRYTGYQGDNSIKFDSVDPELIPLALSSGVQLYGIEFVEHLIASLAQTNDSIYRQRIMVAMASSTDAEVSDRVLKLALSFSLKINERMTLLSFHMKQKDNLPRVFDWFKRYYSVLSIFIPNKFLAYTPLIGRGFCDEVRKKDIETFFEPRLNDLPGAKRRLAQVLEQINMCINLVESQPEIITH